MLRKTLSKTALAMTLMVESGLASNNFEEADQKTASANLQSVIVAKEVRGKLRVFIKPETPEEKEARLEGIKRVAARNKEMERLKDEEWQKERDQWFRNWQEKWNEPEEVYNRNARMAYWDNK